MKKLAIMQPYFFPYLGYFALIKHCDAFILLDEVQFIYHGWIERNRVLNHAGEWQYIAVPLQKHPRSRLIRDIEIDNGKPWQDKLLAQLQHYRRAPYYGAVITLLEEVLSGAYKDITNLDRVGLQAVCAYLGLERELPVFSQMGLEIEPPAAPDEWALNICKALSDVGEYWNPPGGKAFFDVEKYEKAGIQLKFLQVALNPYRQKGECFTPGLSILDVMMTNAPEQISAMLDDYMLV